MKSLLDDVFRITIGLLVVAILLRITWNIMRSVTGLLLVLGLLAGVIVLLRCVFHYRRNRYW